MAYDSFTLPWTITLRHEDVFVAEIDCDLEGMWSITDGEFDFEIDSLIIEGLRSERNFVRFHRPKAFELAQRPLANLLFQALDADWDTLRDRVFDLSQQ